jgi:uncharacterized protein (DUF433 family)
MHNSDRITRTPDVCGSDACVRGTRIPVWELIESRRQGTTDERILDLYEGLTPDDLAAAWHYASTHAVEIEKSLWLNEAAMLRHDGTNVPPEFLRRGRQLGLTDQELREVFEPPLDQRFLDRALGDSLAVGA